MRHPPGSFAFVWFLMVPIAAILVATVAFFFAGYEDAASLVGNLGTLFVMMANVVYIVFFHSRKRWPNTTSEERFKRLFTFTR